MRQFQLEDFFAPVLLLELFQISDLVNLTLIQQPKGTEGDWSWFKSWINYIWAAIFDALAFSKK